LAFLQYFPTKVDYLLAYSEEGYWWSNIENFRLLARTGSSWTAWIYYRKWKSSANVQENNGKKKNKYFKKVSALEPDAIREILDSLTLIDFWRLRDDSLNETRGSDISDDINYIFQLENKSGRQVLESYAPEYFLGKFPDMNQRAVFLRGKDIFRRWWKRYCR
jgi:hypothetical protein